MARGQAKEEEEKKELMAAMRKPLSTWPIDKIRGMSMEQAKWLLADEAQSSYMRPSPWMLG